MSNQLPIRPSLHALLCEGENLQAFFCKLEYDSKASNYIQGFGPVYIRDQHLIYHKNVSNTISTLILSSNIS